MEDNPLLVETPNLGLPSFQVPEWQNGFLKEPSPK